MKILSKISMVMFATILVSCSPEGPQSIQFGKDQCDHCQMTLTDDTYAAELITEKGRVYKFDDISCMLDYKQENADKTQNAKLYVSDFETKQLIPVETATFVKGGELKSPMGGNTAAFSDAQKAQDYADKIGATVEQSLPTTSEEHTHHGHDHHEGHSH